MMTRALVVDDEALARRRILRLLKEREDIEVVGECSGGHDAVAAINKLRPDLVFLDVQMPDLDGFEVLRTLGESELPAVVFVTAYDQYALRAFDACAVDYVLKPFQAERLTQAIDRALTWLEKGARGDNDDRLRRLLHDMLKNVSSAATAPAAGFLERFVVRRGNKTHYVRAAEVDWIESDGNYLRLHVDKASHLVRGTVTDAAGRLDPKRFVRIHRRYIVNADRVTEIQPWFGGDYVVLLSTGAKLRLSRTYRDQFQERMLGG
jgi:two-component system LytT family response regulator